MRIFLLFLLLSVFAMPGSSSSSGPIHKPDQTANDEALARKLQEQEYNQNSRSSSSSGSAQNNHLAEDEALARQLQDAFYNEISRQARSLAIVNELIDSSTYEKELQRLYLKNPDVCFACVMRSLCGKSLHELRRFKLDIRIYNDKFPILNKYAECSTQCKHNIDTDYIDFTIDMFVGVLSNNVEKIYDKVVSNIKNDSNMRGILSKKQLKSLLDDLYYL